MWQNPIRALRRRSGLTQAALAAAGGTSQPTIAAYEADRRMPNLRTAERLAEAAGLEMTVDFGPPLTREDRRSLELHAAVAEKLQESPESGIDAARRTLARMCAAHEDPGPWVDHWTHLLELPVEHIVDVLLDPRPLARELRHNSPFAGLLSAAERARVYADFADRTRARSERPRG